MKKNNNPPPTKPPQAGAVGGRRAPPRQPAKQAKTRPCTDVALNSLDVLVLIDTNLSAEQYEALQNAVYEVQKAKYNKAEQLCLFTNQ